MNPEECWKEKEFYDHIDTYDDDWIGPIPDYWYDYDRWSREHCFCWQCAGRYNPVNHQEDPDEWYELEIYLDRYKDEFDHISERTLVPEFTGDDWWNK